MFTNSDAETLCISKIIQRRFLPSELVNITPEYIQENYGYKPPFNAKYNLGIALLREQFNSHWKILPKILLISGLKPIPPVYPSLHPPSILQSFKSSIEQLELELALAYHRQVGVWGQ